MTDQPDLQPLLPEEYRHLKIDTGNPRYTEAVAAARQAGLSQSQFTAMLGFEAKAVVARQAAQPAQAAAAPAPAPASAPAAPAPQPPTKPYAQMSFAEKYMLGQARRKAGAT
jgi:hypothetical protein